MTEKIRILIVEDEPADAELLLIELKRGGFDPEWKRVDDEPLYREALTTAEWDIIISDFAMPRFDGLKAFEIFSQHRLDVPFIFVSGALGEERAVAAMRAGARDYLVKGQLKRLNAAVRRELAAARDRKRRRLAEAQAREKQHRLAVALQATGACMFEEGQGMQQHYYDTDRWREITGYTLSDLSGSETFPLLAALTARMHKENRGQYRIRYHNFRHGRADSIHYDFRLRHADGHWLHLSLYAVASAWTHKGEPSRSVGLLLDRTENAALEAQLRQSQKLEEVGRLAGGVAHDFNNLLTVIVSFATFAAERMAADHPACDDLQEVIGAADRAQNLTAQLLAFSASRVVESHPFSINDVVRDMSKMLRRVFPERIAMHSTLEDDLWSIYADPGGVSQILMNLCVNARDAMSGGGELTIRTVNICLDSADVSGDAPDQQPGDYVLLTVSDTGSGIDAETQARIFEPFFTTKGPGKGTGLGLSTCYGIARQAGGWISVKSTPDQGTTFEVWFPKSEAAAEPLVTDPQPDSVRGTETILVVEDDPRIVAVAERSLGSNGYRVLSADDGPEALKIAQQQPIHLLIGDFMMPGMNGHELATQVQELHPEISVLYISSYDAGAGADPDVNQHLKHVLQKPFSGRDLARKVREVLQSNGKSP